MELCKSTEMLLCLWTPHRYPIIAPLRSINGHPAIKASLWIHRWSCRTWQRFPWPWKTSDSARKQSSVRALTILRVIVMFGPTEWSLHSFVGVRLSSICHDVGRPRCFSEATVETELWRSRKVRPSSWSVSVSSVSPFLNLWWEGPPFPVTV